MKMSRELSRDQFVARLRTRDKGKYTYLYQVGVLATANDNYVKYAYDYIINNESEEVDGKLQLKSVNTIKRKNSYKYEHSQTAESGSGRGEEWFVLDIFENRNKDYVKAVFGNILDYQIPLKNVREDKGAGKIDFMFEKNNELCIAEVKAAFSPESVLKAIVEIQTYYQIIDKEKLLSDYEKAHDMEIKKVIVLFNNTKGAKQIEGNALVKDLLAKFDIETIILDGNVSFTRLQ